MKLLCYNEIACYNITRRNLSMTKLINEQLIKEEVKEIMVRFGACVASKREEQSITLKQLSQKTGLSIGAISEIESHGKDITKSNRKIPSLYTIIALAMVLDIDLNMFNEVLQSKNERERNIKKKETLVRDTLKQLKVPHKAISSIMAYINILSNIGDMYDLTAMKNIPNVDKKLKRKQDELVNLYSQLGTER